MAEFRFPPIVLPGSRPCRCARRRASESGAGSGCGCGGGAPAVARSGAGRHVVAGDLAPFPWPDGVPPQPGPSPQPGPPPPPPGCIVPAAKTAWKIFWETGPDTAPWTSCEKRRTIHGLNFAIESAWAAFDFLEQGKWMSSAAMWKSSHGGVMRRYFGGFDHQKAFDAGYRNAVFNRMAELGLHLAGRPMTFRKIGFRTGIRAECCSVAEPPNHACTSGLGVIKFCPDYFDNPAFDAPCVLARLLIHETVHRIGVGFHPFRGLCATLDGAQGSHFRRAYRNPDSYAYLFLHLKNDPQNLHWDGATRGPGCGGLRRDCT